MSSRQDGAGATTAIYCRISQDDQQGAGVGRQEKACRELAQRNGWAVLEPVLVDNSISASKYSRKTRKAYARMLEGITEGRINRVVVWNTDRLYRKPRELEDLIELAEKGRVSIASVTGGVLDLSTGDGIDRARFAGVVNASESRKTSDRVKSWRKSLREQHKPSPGPRPFGWKSDQVTPHPTEAPLVVSAYDAVLKGASLSDIARTWNAAKARGTVHWSSANVGRTLTRPRHAGLLVHRDQVIGVGKWEPLIERAKWEQACEVLKNRATGVGIPKRRTMLTGVVICGACGTTMIRDLSGTHRVWRCKHHGCGKASIRVEELERTVIEAVIHVVEDSDVSSLLGDGEERNELASLSRKLNQLDRREEQLAASYAKGNATIRMYEKTIGMIQGERDALNRKVASQARQNVLSSYVGQRGVLQAAWPQLSMDQQRSIITEAIGRVVVNSAHSDAERIVIGNTATAKVVR